MGHAASVGEEVRFAEKLHRAHVTHAFQIENGRVVFVKHIENDVVLPQKAGTFRDGSGRSVPESKLANAVDVQSVLVRVVAARICEN